MSKVHRAEDDGNIFDAGSGGKYENLLNGFIPHSQTPHGTCFTMYHNVAAKISPTILASFGSIIGIGIIDAQGQMEKAVWVQGLDLVNAFRHLHVPLFEFGTEGTAGAEKRIGL